MNELEKLGGELLQGEQGEVIRRLADTDAARRLQQRVDTGALERAAKAGDTEAMRAQLSRALSGAEGQALLQQLQAALRGQE